MARQHWLCTENSTALEQRQTLFFYNYNIFVIFVFELSRLMIIILKIWCIFDQILWLRIDVWSNNDGKLPFRLNTFELFECLKILSNIRIKVYYKLFGVKSEN